MLCQNIASYPPALKRGCHEKPLFNGMATDDEAGMEKSLRLECLDIECFLLSFVKRARGMSVYYKLRELRMKEEKPWVWR